MMEAVIFDLGGVVMESPLHAIARYERARGLPPNAINRAVVHAGDGGAWARLERGELTVEAFCAPFEADCRASGIIVDARDLMARIPRRRWCGRRCWRRSGGSVATASAWRR